MIKHLFKLVWNRKGTNFLISVEIFISFLVLFGVILTLIQYGDNYRRPLGFDYENVWSISVSSGERMGFFNREARQQKHETFHNLMESLRDFSEIEASAAVGFPPYGSSRWVFMDGCDAYPVSDGFRDVMNIRLLEGEWFSEDYDHVDYYPVIINRKFAEERFGDNSPLGQLLNEPDEDERKMRVIGVMEDFRKEGEFSSPANIGFWRISLTNREASAAMPGNMLIRVRAGTGIRFQKRLVEHLQNASPEWSFEITPIETIRQEFLMSDYLAPLMAGGTVVVFLMLMVGLGLTGVLWLTITRRTAEIGLRRAEGATGRQIYFQILGEFLLIATLSMLVGVVILIQFPLLDVLGFVNMGVYTLSILATMAVIYLLTIFSALYPSRLAVRVQPVEALHYE